jgi:drug/metabolite transporter (DMT)-like permease
MQPLGLNLIRVTITVSMLWLLWIFSKEKASINKKHIGRFIACSLTGVVINQILFIKGVSLTLSIHAALLTLVTPIFITIVAAWMGTEPLNRFKIAGLIAGIGGACLLVMERNHSGNASADQVFWGDVFIIINAISYTFYFVLVKPLMAAYKPIHVTRWVFTFGALFMLPIAFNSFSIIRWDEMHFIDYAATLFVAIGATFFAYLFNIYGIGKLGSSTTGAYIYTQPIFAAIIAIILLGEEMTYIKIIAAGLIAGGVYFVNKKTVSEKTTA